MVAEEAAVVVEAALEEWEAAATEITEEMEVVATEAVAEVATAEAAVVEAAAEEVAAAVEVIFTSIALKTNF